MGTSFADLVAIPEFATQWQPVAAQLGLEGATELGVQAAKDRMAECYTDMAGQLGVNPSDAVKYAKEFTMGAQTIAGCVSTAQGLIAAAQGASSPAQVVAVGNMFAGTLIAVATAAGSCTAGVGAIIVAAVGIALDVMSKLGLFGTGTPSYQVCGITSKVQPTIVVGCAFTTAPKVAIGAADWRHFPDPKADAATWYAPAAPLLGPSGMVGLGHLNGSAWVGDCGSSYGKRLIDCAFPNYGAIEREQPKAADASTLANFARAFFTAWKAAHEHDLNGLVPPLDIDILVHTVRIWNRAHAASSYRDLAPGDSALPYAASVMSVAGQSYGADDAASNMVAGRLRIHTGAPVVFAVHPLAVHVVALTLHHLSAPAPYTPAAGMAAATTSAGKALALSLASAPAAVSKAKIAIGSVLVAGLAIAAKLFL